jgi:aryl-alcohol dehydrogenase-like predicted oxidoreductase
MRVLAVLDEIAGEVAAPLAAISLAWLIRQPGITAALASATSIQQLDEILVAMKVELSAEQIERLNLASEELAAA